MSTSLKIMFLDESGDHNLEIVDKTYPMFVLAGCVFDFDYYVNVVEPEIIKLKRKHFGKECIILRSYDIRKQKGEFAGLVDSRKRESFYHDLDQFVESLNFAVIAGAINKLKHLKKYTEPANPYFLCFRFILERTIMYLGKSSDKIILRAESRETHNDRLLAQVYEQFRKNGNHSFIKPEEVRSKIADLSFNQKNQNIAGHQIADLSAYPIGKWALDEKKENPAFEIIRPKIHGKNGNFINYGLKIFP